MTIVRRSPVSTGHNQWTCVGATPIHLCINQDIDNPDTTKYGYTRIIGKIISTRMGALPADCVKVIGLKPIFYYSGVALADSPGADFQLRIYGELIKQNKFNLETGGPYAYGYVDWEGLDITPTEFVDALFRVDSIDGFGYNPPQIHIP